MSSLQPFSSTCYQCQSVLINPTAICFLNNEYHFSFGSRWGTGQDRQERINSHGNYLQETFIGKFAPKLRWRLWSWRRKYPGVWEFILNTFWNCWSWTLKTLDFPMQRCYQSESIFFLRSFHHFFTNKSSLFHSNEKQFLVFKQ